MPTTKRLTKALDTYVNSARPTTPYHTATVLRVDANPEQHALVTWSRPWPVGAVILSATLGLYIGGNMAVGDIISARRPNGPWSPSKTWWNNRPGLTGSTATTTLAGSVASGTLVTLDVTTLVQESSTSGVWRGFRIWSNATASSPYFRSAQHPNVATRPYLEVTWAVYPKAPTDLRPSGNRAVSVEKPTLIWDRDSKEIDDLVSYQVQVNATDVWTDPSYDSGEVASAYAIHDLSSYAPVLSKTVTTTDLSTTITGASGTFAAADVGAGISGTGIPVGATITAVASPTSATISAAATASGTITATITRTFAAIANGETRFWRVRHKNSSGLWSDWSDEGVSSAAQFTRQTKGTTALTNPAASPNDYVEETTPPIAWSALVGRTQKQYRVQILDPAVNKVLWDTNLVTSTATSHDVAPNVITQTGKVYTVRVFIYDTVAREAIPGDDPYILLERDFTFQYSAVPAVVTGLTATTQSPFPSVLLQWADTTMPDHYLIDRDGVIIKRVEAVDLLVSGTSYQYLDAVVGGRREHTWRVRRVVNGQAASNSPTVVKTIDNRSLWLAMPDGTSPIMLVNYSEDIENPTTGEIHRPLGDNPGFIVFDDVDAKFSGSMEGYLTDEAVDGLSALDLLNNFNELSEQEGNQMAMIWLDRGLIVYAYNFWWEPVAGGSGVTDYFISFDFMEI